MGPAAAIPKIYTPSLLTPAPLKQHISAESERINQNIMPSFVTPTMLDDTADMFVQEQIYAGMTEKIAHDDLMWDNSMVSRTIKETTFSKWDQLTLSMNKIRAQRGPDKQFWQRA